MTPATDNPKAESPNDRNLWIDHRSEGSVGRIKWSSRRERYPLMPMIGRRAARPARRDSARATYSITLRMAQAESEFPQIS